MNSVAKCTAIEGVEVSQEELEALREASAFNVLDDQDEEQLLLVILVNSSLMFQQVPNKHHKQRPYAEVPLIGLLMTCVR